MGGCDTVYIGLSEGSNLTIDGNFLIGNGVSIMVDRKALLYIGGQRLESASGITERSRNMVCKKLSIGTEFICGWDVFITDRDFHTIKGSSFQMDTCIGNHVWMASNTSILKGTRIGDNCIVPAGSILHKSYLPTDHLGGGNPFHVLK